MADLSRKLPMNKLNNTRDLGGMRTSDGGVIKDGKLIRSGQLYFADQDDMRRLGDMLSTIIDLRSGREQREKPDPVPEGVEYIYIPPVSSLAAGVSRDSESDAEAFRMVAQDPDMAWDYMCRSYTTLVTDRNAVAAYRQFVQTLLQDREKGVLWHCTAGKDRAGFASVIIEEILGVDREDIIEDHLKTNDYLKEDVEKMLSMFVEKMHTDSEETRRAMWYLFSTSREYLDALFKKTDELYGSFTGFIENALGVTAAQKERLREKYLD